MLMIPNAPTHIRYLGLRIYTKIISATSGWLLAKSKETRKISIQIHWIIQHQHDCCSLIHHISVHDLSVDNRMAASFMDSILIQLFRSLLRCTPYI